MKSAGLVLSCALLLAACTEREASATAYDANSDYRPGFGSSDLPPKGKPLVLPAGVSIVEPIPGIDMFAREKCQNEEDGDNPAPEHGSGDLVQLCVEFRNTTGKPVIVDLPPGMIVESETDDTQHGMLVQRASIVVPPKEQYFSQLNLYCLNNSRGGSGPSSRYRVGPVTQEKDLLALFQLLENKRIPARISTEKQGTIPVTAQIQSIVYSLVSDHALNAQERGFIASLPNK